MQRYSLAFIAILVVAILFRTWIITADGAAFESDEAVVGLMARHINQGQTISTFFYGQDYMGSLDAILVAGGFQLLGESVESIRIVQAALYVLALITAYALAYTITRSYRLAAMALLLLAIPSALGTLYTTISLGGYNEIVILGNVVLLLGWQVTVEKQEAAWRWLVLGLAAGIGWWSNGAIATPLLAVGVMGLRHFSIRQWRLYGIAAVGFLIGSAPWWVYNLRHDWAALTFLTGGFEGEDTATISTGEAILALLVLGLPALYGLRYPWAAGFTITAVIVVGAGVYLVLFTDLFMSLRRKTTPASLAAGGMHELPRRIILARRWVWLVFGTFAVIFLLSSFADATGRYLLPLWVPAAIGIALGLDRMRRAAWWIPAVLLALLLVMQAGTVIRAARSESQLTPQLVERLRIPAEDDTRLLAWLAEHDYTRGYASYWTSFRLIFKSGETVIFETALPHDDDLVFNTSDNRYPPYSASVADADRIVWVTQNFPDLDAVIVDWLTAESVTYQTEQIGVYRVYYDFSRRVAPEDMRVTP